MNMYTHAYTTHTHTRWRNKKKLNAFQYSVLWVDIKWVAIKFQLPDTSSEPSKQTVTTWRELSGHKRLCQMKHGTSSGCDFWELTDANHWKPNCLQSARKNGEREWQLWMLRHPTGFPTRLPWSPRKDRRGTWYTGEVRGAKWQEVWRLLPFAHFLHVEAPASPVSRILSSKYLSGISLNVMGERDECDEFTYGLLLVLGTATLVTLSAVARGSRFW